MGGPLGTASGLPSADRVQRCEGIYRKEVTLTIGGTIYEQGSSLDGEYRAMEFLLRFYPGSAKVQAKDQLDAFANALAGPLGEDWVFSREEERGSMQGALAWAAKDQEMIVLTMNLELRVEARTVEGGSELVLLLHVPM